MCDYSLEYQISRDARVGDRLVTCSFPETPTHGFCAETEPGVAVCLKPGAELAFERPVSYNGWWGDLVNYVRGRLGHDLAKASLARFRQIDLDDPYTHHDALELADGRIIKLAVLGEGQHARVLQLPYQPGQVHRHEPVVEEFRPSDAARALR